MNSPKKIDSLVNHQSLNGLWDEKEFHIDVVYEKLNELIDVVNEMNEAKKKSYTDLDYAEEEINNIEREYRLGLIDIYQYRDGLSTARRKYLEGYKKPDEIHELAEENRKAQEDMAGVPKVFYTSEGDAVGEVEKKCEYTEKGEQCKCLQQKNCGHDWVSLGAQVFCRRCSKDKIKTIYFNEHTEN